MPVARLHVEDDRFINDFQDYCMAMKGVAVSEQAPIIDLMEISLQYYQSIGYEEAVTLFMASIIETDFILFTEKGANEIARILANALKSSEIQLSTFLK